MQEEWWDDAACFGLPSEIFFPEDETPEGDESWQARRHCRDCPVSSECLNFALLNRIEDGIWGGLSGAERREVLRIGRHKPERAATIVDELLEEAELKMAGDTPVRPWTAERRCHRCSARVMAGRWPEDKNGPGATCGRAATYNKGCRCDWCASAKALLHQENSKNRRA